MLPLVVIIYFMLAGFTITRSALWGFLVTALIGLFGIAGGLIGYFSAPMKSYWRVLLIVGGVGLLIPGTTSDIVGAAVIAVVYLLNRRKRKES